MPRTKISEFSATAGNNTDIDGINLAEGMAPSLVNDAIRELMAQLKDFQAGTAGDSFNGPVGTTTAAAGAFTTLSSTGNTTLGDASGDTITINGTTTFANANPILTPGTANGVAYLNGSKVLTTDNTLVYTATGLGIGTSSPSFALDISQAAPRIRQTATTGTNSSLIQLVNAGGTAFVGLDSSAGGLTTAYSLNLFHSGAYPICFSTSGSERMRLDASGNLGLGVTPSAWGAAYPGRIQGVGWAIATPLDGGADTSAFATNAYNSAGSTWNYRVNASAALYQQFTGTHRWYTAPSGTAGNAISFTQAMTLDASGNLGVGTTSPGARLHSLATNEPARFAATSTASYVAFLYSTSSTAGYIGNGSGIVTGGGDANFGIRAESALLFVAGGNAERARITSGGFFKASNTGAYVGSTGSYHELVSNTSGTPAAYIRNTHASSPQGIDISYSAASPNGTANEFVYCQDSTALRASIRSNGGLANYSGNNVNLSDRREKTDFAPAKDYLDTICAIPVQTFNYIDQSEDDPGLTLGVVAQDVQAVAPELVMESDWAKPGEEPKMRLSIYQTDLQYALMKCIQELKAELDSVKAELATLKGN